MEQELKIIGKVSATEKMPSTIDDFYFWTEQNEILSPFDIVKVSHEQDSFTFGMIEEINHITDAPSHFTSYISSDFGDVSENIGNMMRLSMNYVKVKVIGNTKNIYTPVLNGKQVSLCSALDIKTALGLNEVKHPLTCGYLEMYQGKNQTKVKVDLNDHFLLGPEGAHVNISGISGLAAKTSYSMFLLNAIQQKYKENKEQSVAFVFFNVKGRDLMAIDEYNDELKEIDKEIYERELNLECLPFSNVKYYYPYSNENMWENVQTYSKKDDVKKQIDGNKAFRYKFTFEKCKEDLDLLLANEDDTSGTMESCMNLISNGYEKFEGIEKWKTLKEVLKEYTQTGNTDKKSKEITVSSWRKFSRCVKKAIDNNIFAMDINSNNSEVYLPDEIKYNLSKNQVMVIDIARLDENTQAFVFGSVARAIYDLKLGEDRDDIPDKIIFFIDELNKYASNDIPKNSPILRQLLDIAERGRSLGIIMFSVEQFRSAIHDRVKGNCATSCYGRTNAIEVAKADYRYIPKTYQNMMTRLSQGEYIIQNPTLRSIINVKFPKPLYKQFPNG